MLFYIFEKIPFKISLFFIFDDASKQILIFCLVLSSLTVLQKLKVTKLRKYNYSNSTSDIFLINRALGLYLKFNGYSILVKKNVNDKLFWELSLYTIERFRLRNMKQRWFVCMLATSIINFFYKNQFYYFIINFQ